MARLWLKTEILWDMGLSRASRNSSMLENLERDSLGSRRGGAGNDQGFEVREFLQSPLYVLNLIDA